MKKYFLYLTFLFLYSCSNNKSNIDYDCKTINVDLDITNQKEFTDFFELKNIIKLETSSNHLIGQISKVISYKNKFYLQNSSPFQGVFIFDTTGTLISDLKQTGKGPGEFVFISDISVNKYSDQLEVYDRGKQKFIQYDLLGNYLNEFKFDFYFNSFYSISENIKAITVANEKVEFNSQTYNSNFYIIKDLNKIIYNDLPIIFEDLNLFQNNFSQYQDSALLYMPLDNYIYNITMDYKLMPRYFIDFGDRNLNMKNINTKDMYKIIPQIRESDAATFISGYWEFNSHIVFRFLYQKKLNLCYYDKVKNKSFVFNDLGNTLFSSFLNEPIFIMNNELSFLINAQTVIDFFNDKKNIKFKEKFKRLYEKSLELDELSNPLILSFSYK